MALPKAGKKLTLQRVSKRLLWNDPKKLLLYPVIKKVFPYTMVSYEGLCNVYDCIYDINRLKIRGALVEMGCWAGGCGAFMSWCARRQGLKTNVWLFDSFEGLPAPSSQDAEWVEHARAKSQSKDTLKEAGSIELVGSYQVNEEKVHEVLALLGVGEGVEVVKGWFNHSVPPVKGRIGPIALLRLDGDLYESTLYCLRELYDAVVSGGYIILDDYHLDGCRKALYEFFCEREISPFIQIAAYGGRAFFRKK